MSRPTNKEMLALLLHAIVRLSIVVFQLGWCFGNSTSSKVCLTFLSVPSLGFDLVILCFLLSVSVLMCLPLLLVLCPLCLLLLAFCFVVDRSVESPLALWMPSACLFRPLRLSFSRCFAFASVLFVSVFIDSNVVPICLLLRLYSWPFSVRSLYDRTSTWCSTLALTHSWPILTLTAWPGLIVSSSAVPLL